MVTIGTRLGEQAAAVRAIADRHGDVFGTVGIHPHNAGEREAPSVAELLREADHAEGHRHRRVGPRLLLRQGPAEAQKAGFRAHIAAARESGLPLVIHARDADEDTAAILEEEHGQGAFPFCCTASPPVRSWRGAPSRSAASLLLRHPDLPEVGGEPADRGGGAGGPAAGRDGQPLSRPRAGPRQALRAGLCGAHRGEARPGPGMEVRALHELTTANFHRLFQRSR
jgi:TatD DNase family protein